MIYDDVAEALLAAAGVSSGVTGLARSVVAPGPLAAKDCRMVVVWGGAAGMFQNGQFTGIEWPRRNDTKTPFEEQLDKHIPRRY